MTFQMGTPQRTSPEYFSSNLDHTEGVYRDCLLNKSATFSSNKIDLYNYELRSECIVAAEPVLEPWVGAGPARVLATLHLAAFRNCKTGLTRL